ncbi:PREDICTED: uncharacterized protein LOC105568170 [Vollenhovia emeryi]|uniref:uncharacterized protein LOC105568170 n=1 Tax=Vollenhovia emeryi TaxID=411798 RepID=UPI0005F53421|nr:PREDICTED: uncharacterized protein LOC105568170 [Vollenhovia emeryi]
MFMILIGSGVFSLSLNIFLIFQIVLTKYKTEDFYVSFLFITITFVYMFIANLVGQQILDYNNHVYITTYEVKWYVTPVSVQKLLLFLLQRGSKKFGLKVGKLFIPSLESFGMLVNASVSYFTLMYSMR